MARPRRGLLQKNYVSAARNIAAAKLRDWRGESQRRAEAAASDEFGYVGETRAVSAKMSAERMAEEISNQQKEIARLNFRLNKLKQMMIDRDRMIFEMVKEWAAKQDGGAS